MDSPVVIHSMCMSYETRIRFVIISGTTGIIITQSLLFPSLQLPFIVRGSLASLSCSSRMENMQYAEELVREFLVFRGFTSTLQLFESELSTDIGKGFQVEKILDLIFSDYIPKFQVGKLVGLLSFLKHYFSSSEMILTATLSKLEDSIFRYYIVHALRSGRKDKVLEFFGIMGNELLQKGEEWTPWFGVTYSKSPSTEPQFRIFFSKEWFDALRLSVRNFLSQIFTDTHILISSEKNTVSHLRRDIKQLNLKLSQLQALLEEKEKQLQQLKSDAALVKEANSSTNEFSGASAKTSGFSDESVMHTKDAREPQSPSNLSNAEDIRMPNIAQTDAAGSSPVANTSDVNFNSISSVSPMVRDDTDTRGVEVSEHGTYNGEETVARGSEEFSEVKVNFQETFLGHTSPISRSRFSASGKNIASASVDGTVRIWTYGSSSPTRNATIYCGAEILSLYWECKSDRLLLIGTADGGIKAWNVDAKRVVCDLSTAQKFPRVLDIKSSPVEPIFVSAAASAGNGTNGETAGYASLTVWNMRTWKAMTVLPLGEDPPAITSLSFNHNGKILAASAVDGMIHMFGILALQMICVEHVHDSNHICVDLNFKIFEWSLQNQGQILWKADCSRFSNSASSAHCRHEMALDATGKRLLVTSDSVRSPIYQVRGNGYGLKTLPHTAAVTTVDWHPTLPIFLTGSSDNSVRVTSIL
ncbi:WD repeat-containing protein [Drosera capensis]